MSDYLNQVEIERNVDSLLKYIQEDRPGSARVIARREDVDPKILAKLSMHSSEMVRVLIARNLKTPTDVLKMMTLDTNVAIRDSAKFSLGRLGKPKDPDPVVPKQVKKEKPVEDVVKDIKKEKKPKKRRKDKKKDKK